MNRRFSTLRLLLPALLVYTVLNSAASPRAVAQSQAKPLAYLLKYVGQGPYGLWKTQPLQRRLLALLGPTEYKAFVGNLDPATELTQQNGVLYTTGNAPHRGTEEEAVMLVDIEKDAIEVFILHKSTIVRGWAENNRLIAIPKDVQETLSRWPKAQLVQTLNTMRQGAAAAGNSTSPAAPRVPGPGSSAAFTPAPKVCQAGTSCDESNDFAATIIDFRTSTNDRYKIVTANVRFTNKLNRPLTLGLVRDSGVALDDQGNRYVVPSENNVRGIGLIVNNSFDPKFTLQPGETADARIEFLLAMSRNIIYGTSWEANLAIREIDPVGVGQYRMGRESELRFPNLVNRMTAPTMPGTRAAVNTSAPGIATNSTADGSTTRASVPAALPDACNGAPRCYSTGVYSATINSFTASSVGNFHDHVLRFEVRFRNMTNQPLILAYGAGTSAVIDNLGNQYYWGHAGSYDGSVQGIGVSQGQKVNPQFVLQPGESRNAIFQVIRYRPGNAQIGTSFTFSTTIKQLEILPSQQIRETRDFAMTYPDLVPTWGGTGGVNTQNINDSLKKLGGIFGKK
jgi:hypothetical protein